MYIAPGHGQTTPWGQFFLINSILQSIKSFAASFPPLNDFVTVCTVSSMVSGLETNSHGLLVQFGLLSGHLLGNGCPLG